MNDPSSSSFTWPSRRRPAINRKLTGFSRFVTTRGGACCYHPSITAIRHLAAIGG